MRQQPLGVMSLGLSLLTCTRRSVTAQSTTHAFICHRQFCLHLETRAKRMLVVSGPSTGVAHPVADGVCLTSCPVCGRSCCSSRRSVVLRLGQRCLGVGLQLSPCIPPQHHPHPLTATTTSRVFWRLSLTIQQSHISDTHSTVKIMAKITIQKEGREEIVI